MAKKAVITIKDKSLRRMERETAERLCRQILTDSNCNDLGIYDIESVSNITILKQVYPFIQKDELKASEIVMIAKA